MENKTKESVRREYLRRISQLRGVNIDNASKKVTEALNKAVSHCKVDISDDKDKDELISYVKPTTIKALQNFIKSDITKSIKDSFKNFGKK